MEVWLRCNQPLHFPQSRHLASRMQSPSLHPSFCPCASLCCFKGKMIRRAPSLPCHQGEPKVYAANKYAGQLWGGEKLTPCGCAGDTCPSHRSNSSTETWHVDSANRIWAGFLWGERLPGPCSWGTPGSSKVLLSLVLPLNVYGN